jgi:ribosomal protein S18 acetylase RimI-like enzyme
MIREAKGKDIEKCAGCVAGSLIWDRYERNIGDAIKMLAKFHEQGNKILVHESNGVVDGFIGIIEKGMMGEFPYIRLLAVHEDSRGKGIGTALIEETERRYSESRLIFMLVSDFNTRAAGLYTRLGYKKIGIIPDFKKNGIAEHLLLKHRGL